MRKTPVKHDGEGKMIIPHLAHPDPRLVAAMRLDAAKMVYDGRNSPAARRQSLMN
jgi:hypothetical protein